MSELQPKSSGRVVNPDVLQLAPSLLNAPLASPWQRLGGMVVDLVIIALLARLSIPVLGLCAGGTLVAFGSQRESEARFWRVFRWVLIGLGGVVIILSGFLVTRSPILQPRAAAKEATAPARTAEPAPLPLIVSNADLRREVERSRAQIAALQAENAQLRESATGQAVVDAVTGLPRRLGLAFGWAGVYFTLLPTFFRGRTPGKFIFGSRIVRLDARPPTAIDCFWRSGGYPAGLATGCLGFLRLIWHPNHQALQDNIAGTLVLDTRRKRGP
jgi:uncharacterized RDD family membrane protein YckC